MKTSAAAITAALVALWLSACGCCSGPRPAAQPITAKGAKVQQNQPRPLATMTAAYTSAPIVLDGKLDEPVWAKAKAYSLALDARSAESGRKMHEAGQTRLAWDDKFLYVAVNFRDSDVVAEGDRDGLAHYNFGDLCELFLWPADSTWYWELYVTPRGNKSTFWFPSRGRFMLPSCFTYRCGMKVAAHVNGTLNNWRDTDVGWSAEIAMPIADLTAEGDKFQPGADWRIMVARQNRSYCLKGKECSTTPKLSKGSFHLRKEYARLVLAGKSK